MKSNSAAACYKIFFLKIDMMNDRRRFVLAVVLGSCLSFLLLICGEIFLSFSKNDYQEKKTFSVLQVVLGRSIHENISLPETLQSENVAEEERTISSKQNIVEERILPRQSTSEKGEVSVVQEPVSADYSTASSGENNFSISSDSSINITDKNVVLSSEASVKDDTNKLYEMIYTLIEKEKQYPPLARRRSIEGQVDIALKISTAGELEDSNMSSSSNSSILDQAAINLVKNIFPLNINLQSETEITVTIRYSLED
jgi:protein TonB